MKKVDLTEKVMQKVAGYEKRKISLWLGRFAAILVILFGGFLFSAWIFHRVLIDRQIWDLFSLFSQDREIIAEFWQDAMGVIWEEMPRGPIYALAVIVFLVFAVILSSRKKLKIIRRKIGQLKIYKNN